MSKSHEAKLSLGQLNVLPHSRLSSIVD